jgi:hypothetical protein
MRKVGGDDLRSIIRNDGALSTERTLEILQPVAKALDAAHRANLVHRDVKPGNILIEPSDDPESPDRVYLTDFGLAKRTDATRLTKTQMFVGTMAYASPEQFQGTQVDGRADQYALACVLYEVLTGTPPFRGDSDGQLMYAHVWLPPPPLTERGPDLPPEADAVFARAMAKAREDRFPSCTALVSALRGALGMASATESRSDVATVAPSPTVEPAADVEAPAQPSPPVTPAPTVRRPLPPEQPDMPVRGRSEKRPGDAVRREPKLPPTSPPLSPRDAPKKPAGFTALTLLVVASGVFFIAVSSNSSVVPKDNLLTGSTRDLALAVLAPFLLLAGLLWLRGNRDPVLAVYAGEIAAVAIVAHTGHTELLLATILAHLEAGQPHVLAAVAGAAMAATAVLVWILPNRTRLIASPLPGLAIVAALTTLGSGGSGWMVGVPVASIALGASVALALGYGARLRSSSPRVPEKPTFTE